MNNRTISVNEAALYRFQALLEQNLRLQCEIYAHLANENFDEVYTRVQKEVDSSTAELIKLHSHLHGENENPLNN